MKKLERGSLLFLVLVLALSASVSYLALNQAAYADRQDDVQKMTVALVNEDQGATFNGNPYDFGQEFIKNVEKDSTHDWYIVSRGVAESGLARGAYNMMIVIPHDFSEKALSIDATAPEKVRVTYKINASGNNDVRAEAEKTAQTILNDINRRIIDVYFASVIGNLHEAQENIGTIVKKEALYTHTYKNAIHAPLADYTSQFEAVQDNTQLSKDSFQGLQDILDAFGESLDEGAKTNQTFLVDFDDLVTMKEANSLLFNDFSAQLGNLDKGMNQSDVMQQLQELERANKAINEQFKQEKADGVHNIVSESAVIQKYLKETKKKVDKMDADLLDKLHSDIDEDVTKRLRRAFRDKFKDNPHVTLKNLLGNPDERVHKSIQKQINKLPSLDEHEFEDLGFSNDTVTQLQNVMAVTKKYKSEYRFEQEDPEKSIRLIELVNDIKKSLNEHGVNVSDSVTIPATTKWGQELTLTIPDEYDVDRVWLKLPHKKGKDYTRLYKRFNKVKLPKTDEGPFKVNLKLKLKDVNSSIDVFQPVTWSWKLHQNNTEIEEPERQQPDSPSQPDLPTDPDSEEGPPSRGEGPDDGKPDGTTDETEDENNTSTPEEAPAYTSSGTEDDGDGGAGGEQPGEGNGDPGEGEENPVPPAEKVIVTEHYITHKVMSALTDDPTKKLMDAAANTVKEYERLYKLYEDYFGLAMDDGRLKDELRHHTLSDLAGENSNSLYYLFNKENIIRLLATFVVDAIKDSLTEQVTEQIASLQGRVNEYKELVTQADKNSDGMADLVTRTKEQAGVLNTNLAATLAELEKWREVSLALIDEQQNILKSVDGEQTALMTMNGDFNALLTESQSLADQAQGNLRSADSVYDTFDAIDNQAKSIQESGLTLVNDANNLSSNLTDKLVDDQKFADNFSEVLANSRIGERPNETLYSFLSNPVQANNDGVIVAGDTLTPYFLVLVCFIVALFTAYVISTYDQRRLQSDTFAAEMTLIRRNTPMTGILAGIGIVEGLAIGALSAYLLQISQEKFMVWTALIILVMLAILPTATYLLRQLKMVGMFVLLLVLSVYLFLTEALGFDFDKLSFVTKIRSVSPLQYVETLLASFAAGTADYKTIMFVLIAVVIITLALNLFVLHRSDSTEEEVEDDTVSETP